MVMCATGENGNGCRGVKEAIALFSRRFARIVVVTNQRGIERGLMTEEDLTKIHAQMCREVEEAGGKIDAVFHCPIGDPKAPCRKPNPGMLFEAAARFPELRWKKSLMVGDAPSDMEMAHIVGIYSVFIGALPEHMQGTVNAVYPGLREMAADLEAMD